MPRVYVPRGYRPQRNVNTTLRAGPWIGCNEGQTYASSAQDNVPFETDPRFAFRIINGIPHVDRSGGIVQRSGSFYNVAPSASAYCQWIGEFALSTGMWKALSVAGGEIYEATTFSVNLTVWTKRITTADLTTAGITLSATARVHTVVGRSGGADVIVFSDGVNSPFMWDGTAGAGLTVLTNCPVLYGQPTLHAGKLFGIKNAVRGTFVWSEEGDFTIGYEAGGYNNAWDFQQTSLSPLTAILGSNAGLHIWREYGYTMVLGAVDTDFVSSATTDAVSKTIGCKSPSSVAVYRDRVVFVGSDEQVHIAALSGGIIDFPSEHAAWLNAVSYSNISLFESVVDVQNGLAYITRDLRTFSGQTQRIMVLDLLSNTYFGYHTFFADKVIKRMGLIRDSNGYQFLAISTADFEFYLISLTTPSASGAVVDWDGSALTRVPLKVITAALGRDVPGVLTADAAMVRGVAPETVVIDFLTNTGAAVPDGMGTGISAAGSFTGVSGGVVKGGEYWAGFGPVIANEFHVRLASPATVSPNYSYAVEFDAIEVPVTAQPRDPRRV